MSGLHVVIVPAWWPSAARPHAGIFCQDYARAFADAGATVGVIVPDPIGWSRFRLGDRAPFYPRVDEERLGSIPVLRVLGLHTSLGMPAFQMHRFRAWLGRGLEVYRARYGEPDVLHAMCAIPAGWACTHLPGPLASHTVITEHTGPFSLVMNGDRQEPFARDALARANAVVAVSPSLRDQMQRCGIARDILVRGNPVAPEFVRNAAPADGRQVALDTTSPRRLLFAGRLTPEKGTHELMQAMLALRDDADVHWVIVGEGPMQSQLDAMLADAALSARVVRHGFVDRDRLLDLMDAAVALVCPSHVESFGLVVAEALSRGLPVIATSGVGCAIDLTPADGIVVPSRDSAAFIEAVRTIVERADAFDRHAIASRAAERYSPASHAEWYGGLFRSAAPAANQ